MSMVSKFISSTAIILISINSFADTDYQPLGKAADDLSKQAQWNLSISPTGEGLPAGKGTAAQGSKIFALQCAGCHGPEGIGASADPLMGEVGSLASEYPEKTVNSYWPYATTLFDYIRRAMPINAPFSLTADEVYALSAYILSQDGIIAADVELNQENLPQVAMPNRDGFIAIYPE
ncbi:MAG: cytochrome c [Gammaproteobacteria bacterium]|nr:MAG: cytochrome c [Gammaproteobacteria bacterium]